MPMTYNYSLMIGNGIIYLQDNVNNDLQRILHWSESNFLLLNPSKTRAIWFFPDKNGLQPCLTLGSDDIEFVSYYKTLGLHIDNSLDFNIQVNHIISRVNFIIKRFITAERIYLRV